MMNVCSNLQTLSSDFLYDASENKKGEPKRNDTYQDEMSADLNFKQENDDRFERERDEKLRIFDMYSSIFDRNPTLFKEHKEYSLSPLSNLISELFQEFSPERALKSLQILGNTTIDNYSEEMIVKMYNRFSSTEQISLLKANDQKFFLEFAKAWPKFMKNNAIMQQLT